VLATLVDLVLPAGCAGCAAPARVGGLCVECATALAAAQARRVRPTPEPPGLPRCVALAAYAGALREAILAYKERGRHGLARPLGDLLGDVVLAGVPGGAPVVLVPVPDTAAAARQRYGDHMVRLARRAARRLRGAGRTAAVAYPLRARPRPDSARLSRADRERLAAAAFACVPGRLPALRIAVAHGARLVLVDDVVTTGATLAAAANRLATGGLPVTVAAVLAATARRHPPATPRTDDNGSHKTSHRNEG
jgi:predicted amidophosphoribosyltransferase